MVTKKGFVIESTHARRGKEIGKNIYKTRADAMKEVREIIKREKVFRKETGMKAWISHKVKLVNFKSTIF